MEPALFLNVTDNSGLTPVLLHPCTCNFKQHVHFLISIVFVGFKWTKCCVLYLLQWIDDSILSIQDCHWRQPFSSQD